jgi:hypothetical protein
MFLCNNILFRKSNVHVITFFSSKKRVYTSKADSIIDFLNYSKILSTLIGRMSNKTDFKGWALPKNPHYNTITNEKQAAQKTIKYRSKNVIREHKIR